MNKTSNETKAAEAPKPTPHTIDPSNAAKMWDWLQNRGGILIWSSANLSDPGVTWSMPARGKDGQPNTQKPHWGADKVIRHITDPAEVFVSVPKEVKRIRIALRRGSQGMSFKLTDASSQRVRKAVADVGEKYGTDAWYAFEGDEAVIYREDIRCPIARWVGNQPVSLVFAAQPDGSVRAEITTADGSKRVESEYGTEKLKTELTKEAILLS